MSPPSVFPNHLLRDRPRLFQSLFWRGMLVWEAVEVRLDSNRPGGVGGSRVNEDSTVDEAGPEVSGLEGRELVGRVGSVFDMVEVEGRVLGRVECCVEGE